MRKKVLNTTSNKSVVALAEELGGRLKQARLNADRTQSEVAELAGVTRKAVLNAEKGKASLEVLLAIMGVLRLTDQLDNFLPVQEVSPIQLAKLQGRKRQRASGQRASGRISFVEEEPAEW